MKKDLLTYILTLIIVFLCALSAKSKDFISSYFYEQTPEYELIRKDTSLLISVENGIIKLGNQIFIIEKRKCYYSLEDYMIFDEYKCGRTKITFNLDPDTGNILQVDYLFQNKIYYFRL